MTTKIIINNIKIHINMMMRFIINKTFTLNNKGKNNKKKNSKSQNLFFL
jgi:hypothetical protein